MFFWHFISRRLHGSFHKKLGLKASHPGSKKPFIEVTAGDDLRRKTGTWVKKDRIIDRENDRYTETVTDPQTGKVIHYCDEPLSSSG